jgi:Na+-transporting NADH:ubiquinone oxidoreductase subunit C
VYSTGYIIRLILILTGIVALILALMSTSLKPIHDRNEAVYNKRAILGAIERFMDRPIAQYSDVEIDEFFSTKITQKVIDSKGETVDEAAIVAAGYKKGKAEDVQMGKERKKPEDSRIYPVFIFNDGNKDYHIISVRGNGLWDEIWGNIAMEGDFNTIAGATFDHKGETPGLGAEIKDNPQFPAQFTGKKIFENGEYKSVLVRKGGAKDPVYEVDGITGATITADGVSDMMYDGIAKYLPYFEKAKNN